jgi:hypothetical protein
MLAFLNSKLRERQISKNPKLYPFESPITVKINTKSRLPNNKTVPNPRNSKHSASSQTKTTSPSQLALANCRRIRPSKEGKGSQTKKNLHSDCLCPFTID